MTPSQIGERAEIAVAHALTQSGKHVLWPLSSSQRYDLVFEDEVGFHRVQVKAGRVYGEVVFFATCSRTGNVDRDYRDQIEYFAVYVHARGEVYLVPVSHVGMRGCHLRLAPTRNAQVKGIRWARDYLLGNRQTPARSG